MRKLTKSFVLAFCLYGFAAFNAAAQDIVEGRWRGEIKWNKMCLSLKSSMQTEKGRWKMSFSEDIALKEFEGLEQARHSAAEAEFKLSREAGTFIFTGKFNEEQGSGDFKFVINPSFTNDIKALGYAKPAIDRVFMLAMHGIGTSFIKEMQALGYNKLPLDQLVQMAIHDVTPAFVREMRELGYNRLSIDDLVQLRIHGVDADYVREMNAAIGKPPKP